MPRLNLTAVKRHLGTETMPYRETRAGYAATPEFDMRQVLFFSFLLIVGLVLSQFLPLWFGAYYGLAEHIVRVLTMVGLSFIMIHVGYEFDIDKSRLGQYGWDYIVAMTAAAFPWIFVALYFIYVMLPAELWSNWDAWKESLLSARFAAPTSAGVLFSMLAAAGLGATWLFHKARILAIFDDLDTVLLMIPLKIMMVGLVWQLGAIFAVVVLLLWAAWVWLHRWRIPLSWPWVMAYAALITVASELIYFYSKNIDDTLGIHIEVLLPAFVLGCLIARPADGRDALHTPREKRAALLVSGVFMVLVGLSMPAILSPADMDVMHSPYSDSSSPQFAQVASAEEDGAVEASVLAAQPFPGWGWIAFHVLMLTVISNLGKMFPAFCYRKEAHWKERLALSIGMWPRGEVGAGVLVVSLGYGIGGPVLTVALLSLALNLLLTGVFIVLVKKLLTAPDALAWRKQAG
jgi:Kef-type K+ transport system membrane component KefB